MKRPSFGLALLIAACASEPQGDAPYLDDRLYPEAIQRASATTEESAEPMTRSSTVPEAVASDASTPQ
jgi:hypothetical protein